MDISTVIRPISNSAHGISINHVYQHSKSRRKKSNALRKKKATTGIKRISKDEFIKDKKKSCLVTIISLVVAYSKPCGNW
jgi:hypothetical protein